jgi:hypothetical protein
MASANKSTELLLMTDTTSVEGNELSSDVLGIEARPMKAAAFTGVIKDTL